MVVAVVTMESRMILGWPGTRTGDMMCSVINHTYTTEHKDIEERELILKTKLGSYNIMHI